MNLVCMSLRDHLLDCGCVSSQCYVVLSVWSFIHDTAGVTGYVQISDCKNPHIAYFVAYIGISVLSCVLVCTDLHSFAYFCICNHSF